MALLFSDGGRQRSEFSSRICGTGVTSLSLMENSLHGRVGMRGITSQKTKMQPHSRYSQDSHWNSPSVQQNPEHFRSASEDFTGQNRSSASAAGNCNIPNTELGARKLFRSNLNCCIQPVRTFRLLPLFHLQMKQQNPNGSSRGSLISSKFPEYPQSRLLTLARRLLSRPFQEAILAQLASTSPESLLQQIL